MGMIMVPQFGVFDHIEPQAGSTLKQSSDLRLTQIENWIKPVSTPII